MSVHLYSRTGLLLCGRKFKPEMDVEDADYFGQKVPRTYDGEIVCSECRRAWPEWRRDGQIQPRLFG